MEENLDHMHDSVQLEEELSALSSIYGNELSFLDDSGRNISFQLSPTASLCISLPDGYPSKASPIVTLVAPSLRGETRSQTDQEISSVVKEFTGQSMLYGLVEKARELTEACENGLEENTEENSIPKEGVSVEPGSHVPLPEIIHGIPFTERRSTFQAHLAVVHSVKEVQRVLQELKRNRKIAEATHNIMAYRICGQGDSWVSDCDDDGESQAGSRLLHLLNIMDVRNVVVVISRWFGGVLLGPERFKHITNAARNILTENAAIIAHKAW
ncbi:hypothetical protein RvY_02518 [Ramazzottius varieornatus]|uniref:RWD domain-containing protein n=1 Tax=Ramazzottius varieornatus TaxID=947166 RepID=A0A1D1UND5_RAMVA|nr:hypothetical protein RvY_02518 [Ramazzottius varieornatus]